MSLMVSSILVLITGVCLFALHHANRRLDQNRKVLDWALAQARRHDSAAVARIAEQAELERLAREKAQAFKRSSDTQSWLEDIVRNQYP